MLKQRVLVALILLPIGVALIFVGGLAYLAMVAFFMAAAVWEYAHLFTAIGRRPARFLMVGAALVWMIARYVWGFQADAFVLTAVTLVLMVYHLWDYEHQSAKAPQSGVDFAVSLSGVVYLGFLGAYMVSLRQLPAGAWWVLLALPVIWIADSGAYFVGRAWGKHKLSPRLSPKKTWEGYLAGVLTGTIAGAVLAWVYPLLAGQAIAGMTPFEGAVLGLLISALAPLGDLGESMFKRQAGVKDSGHLLPGHGGAFDRVDSWLWAGVLAYYFVLFVT
ncbi:MAG: phosphatidate cytidylyltransferase [Chloroflexi bacterium]|nr:phosphatidate cytidylyltransferase [Chloroflexota bacterium]